MTGFWAKLNRVSTWKTSEIHTLKFDHFCIFLFVLEVRRHIPKWNSTRLNFNQKIIRIDLSPIRMNNECPAMVGLIGIK